MEESPAASDKLLDYIKKIQFLASEPNDIFRDAVSNELIQSIESEQFVLLAMSIFSGKELGKEANSQQIPNPEALKIITASLLKDFIKASVKSMDYEKQLSLYSSLHQIMCLSSTTIETKEALAECVKLGVLRASSKLGLFSKCSRRKPSKCFVSKCSQLS